MELKCKEFQVYELQWLEEEKGACQEFHINRCTRVYWNLFKRRKVGGIPYNIGELPFMKKITWISVLEQVEKIYLLYKRNFLRKLNEVKKQK